MTLASLQALTWTTVCGAVASALLLASLESRTPEWSRLKRAQVASRTPSAAPEARPVSSHHRLTPVSDTAPRREAVAR